MSMSGNKKPERAKEIIDELEAFIAAYNEYKLNLKHRDDMNGFSQLFQGGKADNCSIAAYNNHQMWVEYRRVVHAIRATRQTCRLQE